MKALSFTRILLVFFLVMLPVGYAWYLFPTLPDTIPTHFNAAGEPDAWGKKSSIFFPASILGVVSLLVYSILANIKKLDPKRYASTDDRIFRQLALFTVLFLSVLSVVITYSVSHEGIKIDKLLFPLLGLAFAVFGRFMSRINQNYFAGIRLPWTLDSERNWNATHHIAGKIWVWGGSLIFISGIFLDREVLLSVFFSLIGIMFLVPVVYSYLLFRREKKGI